jgi:hypothetical protein
MDSENDGAFSAAPVVYAPSAGDARESPGLDGFVECLIPDPAGLFHAIYALHKSHDPVFFAGGFKAGWLFHEHCFGLREDAV